MSPLFKGGSRSDHAQGDRSAEERERARAEREARRAARDGRAAPAPAPPAAPADVADVAAAADPEPPRVPDADAPQPWESAEPEPPAAVAEPFVAAEHRESSPPGAVEVPPAGTEPVAPEPEALAEPVPPAGTEPVAPEPEALAEPVPPVTEPVAPVPPVTAEPEPASAVAYEPEPAFAWPEPAASPEPAGAAAPATGSAPVTADMPSVVVHGRSDEAVGVKRVAASAMASAAGAEGPPRFGAPPRAAPRVRHGRRRAALVLLLLVVAAVAFFLYRLYEPGKSDGTGRVPLKIPAGASASQIGDLLAKRDIVASSFFFGLRARLSGDRSKLRSGAYVLRHDMSYAAALTALTKVPPAPPRLARLTIPEGPSRREVVPLVRRAGLTGSYLTASRRSQELDPRDYGAPKSATLEGFLFPATYDLKPSATARSLVTQQLRAFKRAFAQIDLRAAKRRNLSRFDVLTIASMVEREAGVEKDRRLIAGVIYNRLKQGMPLGIDATIRYQLGNFASPLKASELQRDTPYNTRTRTGLPPGPIGNPGLASLRAAARPASNGYLFYVVRPCGNGAHAFSSTDAQFQKDVAAYNAKRAQLGGKDPSRC